MTDIKNPSLISDMIFQFWPEQASRAGRANVNDIIQDLLIDEPPHFTTPEAGHHIELVVDLNIILSAGTFLLALVDIVLRELRNRNNIDSTKLEVKAKEIKPQEITLSDEKIKLIIIAIVDKVEDDAS